MYKGGEVVRVGGWKFLFYSLFFIIFFLRSGSYSCSGCKSWLCERIHKLLYYETTTAGA